MQCVSLYKIYYAFNTINQTTNEQNHVKLFMLIQNQVKEFLDTSYRKLILSQIPATYNAENVLLNISLKLDLAKILRSNRQMGTLIISQFPQFQNSAKIAIENFMGEQGLSSPEHGIHLITTVANCPLPSQNIKSAEFQLAGFEQLKGVMVYLKDVLVSEVSQQEIFLFSCTQIWSARCNCDTERTVKKLVSKSLLNIIQSNANQEDKLRNQNIDAHKCQKCTKAYHFVGRENQIYLNCQKVQLMLPKREEKEAIFESREYIVYGELSVTNQLRPGIIISCCSYIFSRPAIVKANAKQPIILRSEYAAFLMNVQIHSAQANLLTIRPDNSSFFYEISNIGLPQKYCQELIDVNTLLYNYEKLVEAVDKLKFSYLPPSMLTTLKLSLLNSVCNHHANKSLNLCLIVEDLQLALRIMYITGLDIKRWPSDYDNNSLINWLKCCRGCIVIVVSPTKKDFQFLEQYFSHKLTGLENISLTFWVLCESNPRKDINIDHFGVVLDLTTEKNIHICKQAIEQSIDLKLSAFVYEQFDSYPTTIAKPKNIRARIELIEKKPPALSQAEKQNEQTEGKHILQSYYLKSRDLKKTSTVTLSYLYQLAKGFAYLRSALNGQDWLLSETHISILDSVLAIFLDEESARNKVSNSNTIFGAEISKLILNEQECEISFWDYLSQQDGTMVEQKSYMPKSEMFKKMLYKLNTLLFEDSLIFGD